jgi:hypothetical protein
MMKMLLFVFLLLFQVVLEAQATLAPNSENLEIAHCPNISQIRYDPNTKRWGVGNWLGSEVSFEKKLIAFRGAQWVGANVGTIICVYKGESKVGFPVTLQNSTLVPMPKGSNWGKYQRGRKNCPPYVTESPISVQDCSFYVPKDAPEEDVYEVIRSLKKRKPNQFRR